MIASRYSELFPVLSPYLLYLKEEYIQDSMTVPWLSADARIEANFFQWRNPLQKRCDKLEIHTYFEDLIGLYWFLIRHYLQECDS